MRKLIIALGLGLLLVAGTAGSCDAREAEKISDKSRRDSLDFRAEQMHDAEVLIPIRSNSNFPRRAALEEYNHRTDRVGTPYYIYILAETGNIIGYYVATTDPVNACAFLASTEDIETRSEGVVVLTSPSLDGMYYGGSGASAGCDEWFFFDAATNAMIKIRGVNFFVADQPLALQADAIQVQAVDEEP